MTPKEKAVKLVGQFMDYVNCWDNEGANYKQAYTYAKKCALIVVEEIIDNGFNPQLSYNYWEQVKQEIEKL